MPKSVSKPVIDSFSGKYSFLSNFYPSELIFHGRKYPTAEHAFQAAKAIDPKEKRIIREAGSPGKAKRLGRAIAYENFRKDWDDVRVHIMREILEMKFGSPALKKRLLATGDATLIEGNNWFDYFWGACPMRTRYGTGKIWEGESHLWYGENTLGLLLMELREKLRG